MADQTHNVDASLNTDNFSTGAKSLIDKDVPENLYDDPDGVPLSGSVGASVPSATVSAGATVWLGDHVDASVHPDHVSTAAQILIDSDIPANLYDDPEEYSHYYSHHSQPPPEISVETVPGGLAFGEWVSTRVSFLISKTAPNTRLDKGAGYRVHTEGQAILVK